MSTQFIARFLYIVLFSFVLNSAEAQSNVNIVVAPGGEVSFKIKTQALYLYLSPSGRITGHECQNINTVTYSNIDGRVTKIGNLDVNYDIDGRIYRIGSTDISYDISNRVIKIGDTGISYDINSRIYKIGNEEIKYNFNGRFERTEKSGW